MNNPPKISIIIPSFGQGAFIEEAILSLIEQDYPALELIAIDGGSIDETVDILQSYEKHFTYWVSEPDRGQSHAINKGIEHASGDIIQWINSDDLVLPGTLQRVADSFMKDPEQHMIAGKVIKFGEGKEEMLVPRDQSFDSFESFLLEHWLMQPACFFRGDIFKSLAPINERFRYAMDTDLFVRYILKYGKEKMKWIDEPLVRFRMHDESKTFSNQLGFYSERFQIDCNIMRSGLKDWSCPANNLVIEDIPLESYPIYTQIDPSALEEAFQAKWGAWLSDASKKYREVADYAGLHGDLDVMRAYARKAILANPFNALNYRYFLHTFKKP